MNILEGIKTRRSTRKFLDKPVEMEKLEAILEAGRYAPSGKNYQGCHFIVVQDKEKIGALQDLVIRRFKDIDENDRDVSVHLKESAKSARNENYVFHFNPPVFILVANIGDTGNNYVDSACALQNMMLACNELDLGSCWINQLRWLNEDEETNAILRESYGLGEDEKIYGCLSLGYPDTEDGLPKRDPSPRKGNEVTWLD